MFNKPSEKKLLVEKVNKISINVYVLEMPETKTLFDVTPARVTKK